MEILLMIIRRTPRLSTELTEAWSKIIDFPFWMEILIKRILISGRRRGRTLNVCSHGNDITFPMFPSNYGKDLTFIIEDMRNRRIWELLEMNQNLM
jgi:hypothetical protein